MLGILSNHLHSLTEIKSVSLVCLAFIHFVLVSLFFRILAYMGQQSTMKSGNVVVDLEVERFSMEAVRINGLQRVSSCPSFGSFEDGT